MNEIATMVDVRNLVVKFGEVAAVSDISFQVKAGEVFGLLGPNGAGKTTIISVLSCLLAPTSGSICVGAFDIVRNRDEVKRIIGIVPQELGIYPTLSARENLEFFARLEGLRGEKLRSSVASVLEIVGLTQRAHQQVDKFSGGMKRRLNLGIGLVHKPQVLFLDEPTVGVDPQSRNHIFESIEALRSEGVAIIYTTHYMEEAERLCDRIGILDGGNILAIDTLSELEAIVGGGLIKVGVDELVNGNQMLKEIDSYTSVDEIYSENKSLTIRSVSPHSCLLDVLNTLSKYNISFTSLEVIEPNLETVFLQLTGKQLRDRE